MKFFRQLQQTEEELNQLKVQHKLEVEAKENRELQLTELEQTLAKETERSMDLKVLCQGSRVRIRPEAKKNFFFIFSDKTHRNQKFPLRA